MTTKIDYVYDADGDVIVADVESGVKSHLAILRNRSGNLLVSAVGMVEMTPDQLFEITDKLKHRRGGLKTFVCPNCQTPYVSLAPRPCEQCGWNKYD